MRVSRSLALTAWVALTCTFAMPFIGLAYEIPRQWLMGNNPAALMNLPGLGSRLGFLALLVFGGILACVHELRHILEERALSVAQSNFASAVTHELRTPVATIRMYAEMLQQGIVTDPAQRERFLGDICHECDRLGGLIDDVLMHTQMSEQKREYRFERVNANELVDEALAAVQGPLTTSGLTVERAVPANLTLDVDRRAITHALVNLIGNATKYAAAGKRVRVDVRTSGDAVEFAVQDYGPGIPKAEQGEVFRAFYRAGDELTRTASGSGLGLALVKDYVQAHQGTVVLASEPGAGAIFTIRLPRARGAA